MVCRLMAMMHAGAGRSVCNCSRVSSISPFATGRKPGMNRFSPPPAAAPSPSAAAEEAWRNNLVTEPSRILEIAAGAAGRVVAVLGIKTEKQAEQPAFRVPQYLQRVGFKVIPVPVFYPDVTEILGEQVYRKVSDVPEPIDILNVFRKPSDIPAHVEDILAARPKVVWLQQGISHPEVEEVLARAGIQVVADRCLMVDHRLGAAGVSHL